MNFLESPTWAGILNFQGAVAQVEEDQWERVLTNERGKEIVSFRRLFHPFFFSFCDNSRDKILCD